MKLKRFLFVMLSMVGALLLLAGFVFTSAELKSVTGLCYGLGSAMLALGIGNLIYSFVIPKEEYEKVKHLKAIEVNDERNIRIREKSGYLVSKVTMYMICILILVLGIMNVSKLVLFMVITLLIVKFVLLVIFTNYFSKRI
jgi:uncharacterized membrane protein